MASIPSIYDDNASGCCQIIKAVIKDNLTTAKKMQPQGVAEAIFSDENKLDLEIMISPDKSRPTPTGVRKVYTRDIAPVCEPTNTTPRDLCSLPDFNSANTVSSLKS